MRTASSARTSRVLEVATSCEVASVLAATCRGHLPHPLGCPLHPLHLLEEHLE